MFRLQDRTAMIPDVTNRTLTLIEWEDGTRCWGNFLVYFSHNVMNLRGWGYIFIAGQGSQAYVEMLV
jgi:hypothetical protein